MISLKTLHLATAQEVFDQVKDHLLKQNANWEEIEVFGVDINDLEETSNSEAT